jgi:hypothetical protein
VEVVELGRLRAGSFSVSRRGVEMGPARSRCTFVSGEMEKRTAWGSRGGRGRCLVGRTKEGSFGGVWKCRFDGEYWQARKVGSSICPANKMIRRLQNL